MTRSGATARHIEICVSGGRLVWSMPELAQTVAQAIALAPQQLTIDLAACSGIDAVGIQLLLDTHRQVLARGGLVTLKNANERVLRNLRLSMLDRVLQIAQARRTKITLKKRVG